MSTRLDELKAKLDADRKLAEITSSFNGIHLHSVVPGISREERAEAVRYARRLVAEWSKSDIGATPLAPPPESAEDDSPARQEVVPAPDSSASVPTSLEGEEPSHAAPTTVSGDLGQPTSTPEAHSSPPPSGSVLESMTEPSPEAPPEKAIERRAQPRTPIESAARIERASRLASEDGERLEPTIRAVDELRDSEIPDSSLGREALPPTGGPLPTPSPEDEERSGTGIFAISLIVFIALLAVSGYWLRDQLPDLLSWDNASDSTDAQSATPIEPAAEDGMSAADGASERDAEAAEEPVVSDTRETEQSIRQEATNVATESSASSTESEPAPVADASPGADPESDGTAADAVPEVLVETEEEPAEDEVPASIAGAEPDAPAQAELESSDAPTPDPEDGQAAVEQSASADQTVATVEPEAEPVSETDLETPSAMVSASDAEDQLEDLAAIDSPVEEAAKPVAATDTPPPTRGDEQNVDRSSDTADDAPIENALSAALAPEAADEGAAEDGAEIPSADAFKGDPDVRAAQQHLARLGYDAGDADGLLGPKTRRAVRAFQRDIGVLPNGKITPELLAALAAAR